jgi:hypothetical protein
VERGEGDPGQANVGRAGLHVQAVASHPAALLPEALVGGGTAISTDHVEGGARSRDPAQIVEQVEEGGVDRLQLAGEDVPMRSMSRSAWDS